MTCIRSKKIKAISGALQKDFGFSTALSAADRTGKNIPDDRIGLPESISCFIKAKLGKRPKIRTSGKYIFKNVAAICIAYNSIENISAWQCIRFLSEAALTKGLIRNSDSLFNGNRISGAS